MSAFTGRPATQNAVMHEKLGKEIASDGHAPVEVTGEWSGLTELGWAIPGVGMEYLVEMARRYGQDSVVFCPRGGKPRVLSVSGVPVAPASKPEN